MRKVMRPPKSTSFCDLFCFLKLSSSLETFSIIKPYAYVTLYVFQSAITYLSILFDPY